MLIPLNIPPGFSTEDSAYASGMRWIDGDNVRFRAGKLEKIGGAKIVNAAALIGTCRGLKGWSDLLGRPHTAMGTHKKLYIYYGGTPYDITPVDATGTLAANPFSMTNTFATVTVTSATHGRAVGDYVNFSGATAAGGITKIGRAHV